MGRKISLDYVIVLSGNVQYFVRFVEIDQTPGERTRTLRGTLKKLNNDGKSHIRHQCKTVTTYTFEITVIVLVTNILPI